MLPRNRHGGTRDLEEALTEQRLTGKRNCLDDQEEGAELEYKEPNDREVEFRAMYIQL